jgi:hypothetical protein
MPTRYVAGIVGSPLEPQRNLPIVLENKRPIALPEEPRTRIRVSAWAHVYPRSRPHVGVRGPKLGPP